MRKDGTFVSISADGITSYDEKGDFLQTHCILRDITERKIVENKLRSSSLYARSLIEASLDPMITISLDGMIMDVNKATELVTGVPRENMIGSDFFRYFTDPQKAKEGYQDVIASGFVKDYPLTIRHTSGRTIDVLYNATVYRNEIGDVQGVFAAARDVTERKRIEEALRESEERYRSLINTSSDAIYLSDIKWKNIIFKNDAFYTYLGFEVGEVSDEEIFARVHPEDAVRFRSRHDELFKTGNLTRDFRIQHKDGHWLYCIGRYRVIYDDNYQPKSILAVIRDISDYKRTEDELQRMQARLAHVARLSTMGEMVASIAHEVNQPLYSIVNYAKACGNILSKDAVSLRMLNDWIDKIATSAVRAGEIIKRLRDFVRKSEMSRKPTSINDVVKESLAMVAFEAHSSQIITKSFLSDDQPLVMLDRIQIQQVLVNLFKNAYDVLVQKSKGDKQMTVFTTLNGDFVEISVADNGSGLSDIERSQIFEPFFTTKKDGLGMGLAISKTIVEAHGGRIWATSNFDIGVSFHFLLPLAQGERDDLH